MAALVFHMCVDVFGLIVLSTATGASRRGLQALYYAMISCMFVDLCLEIQGHTRLINEPSKSMLPMAWINYIGSPLWLFIYPSIDGIPFTVVLWIITELKIRDRENAKKATDAEREQQRIDGPNQESKKSL